MARCGDGLDSCWAIGKTLGRRASGERKEAHEAGGIHAHNTFESPDAVRPETHAVEGTGAGVRYTFPPASVTRFEIALS
jgi:hypothetical protein